MTFQARNKSKSRAEQTVAVRRSPRRPNAATNDPSDDFDAAAAETDFRPDAAAKAKPVRRSPRRPDAAAEAKPVRRSPRRPDAATNDPSDNPSDNSDAAASETDSE